MRSWTEESMRSPSCNELPGQHGILLRRLLTYPLYDDHRESAPNGHGGLDVGFWKELDAVSCQKASDALLIAISFFLKTD
ncbi:hypothetical protein B9Z55_006854 [Caenorhabditis nigoni]|uniref:Uncharacterized protein n=1 Tax=Caenorhabditis nigoni TaxID=1611254 RepID=A0A2G5V792_9PELO|nr:hypothetical protein B9Z55_006854 [Caenorhabditis nigoni]